MPEKREVYSLFDRLQAEIGTKQSYWSLILGIAIVAVAGILLFNFFNRSLPSLGPAQQTVTEEAQKEEAVKDIQPENLPGKYTVKEGDTLFTIAEKYYKDGTRYQELANANNLQDPNLINVDQVLEIPKLEAEKPESGTGGDPNQTIWGEKITGETYVVVEGDWLSKIAGRAYGNIWEYPKLAEVNNIKNPDLIFPGQVLKIPR